MKFERKPIVSYWKANDPCLKLDVLRPKLTEINIIETKNLTDKFVEFCIEKKDCLYLHVVINGMGGTLLEPNIPTVRSMFFKLKQLIDNGFPQKQILVIVKPILPNDNGLKALKLLLKVFTEFKPLRLRFIRFNVLSYTQLENNKFVIANSNITKRPTTKNIGGYLSNVKTFWYDYYKLIDNYKSIISVDSNEEALIGIRELMAFGINNEWILPDGTREKIINYERGNKFKPVVNVISEKSPVRCSNRCLLCPYRY